MTELSVIIPARQEQYLQKTIDSVLSASEADTEVIVVCDGNWPSESIPDHPKVVIIHHTEPRGQRASINEAAKIARGKYVMKLDAHCSVSQGFDRILIEHHREGITQLPTMYNLDVEKWEPKRHKRTEYMYIGFNDKKELRTLYYSGKEWKRWHSRTEQFDETMSCMGPGWFLSKDDFWKWGGCDEGHGSWGSQGIEVALKAWLLGDGLYVNKHCWFAHWFRASDGGFPYSISGRDIQHARKYAEDIWTNGKVPGQKRTLRWLVDKFNPPGWEGHLTEAEQAKQLEVNSYVYTQVHSRGHDTQYRGVTSVKMPSDLLLYHRVIWETRPELIIEIGTRYGGTALYLQDQLDLAGDGGKVVTVDIRPQVAEPDSRITYLIGDSLAPEIESELRRLADGKRTMVILDGKHTRVRVKNELHRYAGLVGRGCYLVVEDCYSRTGELYGPGEARDWFLSVNKDFEQTNLDREYVVGLNVGGWLRRK